MFKRITLLGPLALSLIGHACLLMCALHDVSEPLQGLSQPLRVALLVAEAPEEPVLREPKEIDPESPKEAEDPTKTTDAIALAGATTITEEEILANTENQETPNRGSASLITRLTSQLPAVVAELNPLENMTGEMGHRGAPIPKLPGSPSALDAWLGPVQSNLDRWVDPSGGVNARLTLANGQIVCIEIRGPTTQELFNPWMSPAIPMTRLCGKKRPKALDLTNPWLRTRPRTP